MKELKAKEKAVKEIVSTGTNFSGYTIEEIRFQRALTAMEADFCKAKFLKNLSNLQKVNPLSPTSHGTFTGKAGSVVMKLLNGLNYIDYALLGLSLFNGTRKVLSFFKRGKRK
ncbi:MAG: hypothetical protein J1E95_01950 [Muribaculaceae bacterium]|nr:hypothetical protein [Muribaculaceae bacterium]